MLQLNVLLQFVNNDCVNKRQNNGNKASHPNVYKE
ncbi:hypothetical protein tloyanaT_22650 [Thalassotalea loyana]|uniref:Uncharacterized protein n=1 Tax=Thalassotalea loyana TaxID=280483 RepID=A0ABQ6HD44_9GAMM|nr:hypothetical protein tloyanaT_22650 [Thalassotalea loyana]